MIANVVVPAVLPCISVVLGQMCLAEQQDSCSDFHPCLLDAVIRTGDTRVGLSLGCLRP